MRLKDKVALITGAGTGIGKAIAQRFAEEGAHVAMNLRPGGPPSADEARKGLEQFNPLIVPADVTKRSDVEAMVAATVKQFGRLDIAVCNAGIEIKKPFLEITDDDWNKVLAVNLYGAFVVSQLAARQMAAQGGGKIIFTSSVHEDIPFPAFASYCASKGGIRMLMRTMALELATSKINVNNIAPGAIATPINQKVLQDPVAKKNAVGEIPWGRFGEPAEVAAVAVFLASNESNYVTGSTYYVDGGMTQQVTRY